MEGIIKNFRRGRHTVSPNHMVIIVPDNKGKEDAAKLVGKKVIWTSPAKKEILGKIAAPHGCKGAVRAIFEKGMPGQALGTKVKFQ